MFLKHPMSVTYFFRKVYSKIHTIEKVAVTMMSYFVYTLKQKQSYL